MATIIVIVTDVATYEPDEVAPTKNDYVLKEFPPEDPIEVAALASLTWFLCVGIYMCVRGES